VSSGTLNLSQPTDLQLSPVITVVHAAVAVPDFYFQSAVFKRWHRLLY